MYLTYFSNWKGHGRKIQGGRQTMEGVLGNIEELEINSDRALRLLIMHSERVNDSS